VKIFLDIDGVMVPATGWKSPQLLDDGFPVFSNKATLALQSLVSEDVTIVLTTSHKSNYCINEWKNIFNNRGIAIKNLEALPENKLNLNRREELLNWFNMNHIADDFIIIDDDKSLNELPDYLRAHLVQTSPYIGLTDEHCKIIKTMINGGLWSA
jgi:hypothetical protein